MEWFSFTGYSALSSSVADVVLIADFVGEIAGFLSFQVLPNPDSSDDAVLKKESPQVEREGRPPFFKCVRDRE
jgi:hypothetical protein